MVYISKKVDRMNKLKTMEKQTSSNPTKSRKVRKLTTSRVNAHTHTYTSKSSRTSFDNGHSHKVLRGTSYTSVDGTRPHRHKL